MRGGGLWVLLCEDGQIECEKMLRMDEVVSGAYNYCYYNSFFCGWLRIYKLT